MVAAWFFCLFVFCLFVFVLVISNQKESLFKKKKKSESNKELKKKKKERKCGTSLTKSQKSLWTGNTIKGQSCVNDRVQPLVMTSLLSLVLNLCNKIKRKAMLLNSISWLNSTICQRGVMAQEYLLRRMFPLPPHPLKTLIRFFTWCLLLGLRNEQLHPASNNSDGKESACNAEDLGLIPR